MCALVSGLYIGCDQEGTGWGGGDGVGAGRGVVGGWGGAGSLAKEGKKCVFKGSKSYRYIFEKKYRYSQASLSRNPKQRQNLLKL